VLQLPRRFSWGTFVAFQAVLEVGSLTLCCNGFQTLPSSRSGGRGAGGLAWPGPAELRCRASAGVTRGWLCGWGGLVGTARVLGVRVLRLSHRRVQGRSWEQTDQEGSALFVASTSMS